MKPFSLNDPDLAELEAELLAKNIRLDQAGQQALLYHAAFRAGQAKATKTTRLWQAYTAALGMILVVTLFPWNRPSLTPPMNTGQSLPTNIPLMITAAPKEDLPLGSHGDPGQSVPPWENWAQGRGNAEVFDQALEKFAQLDARERSYSLIQFSHLESLGY